MVQERLCLTCSEPFAVPPTSKRAYCSVACQPRQSHPTRKRDPIKLDCARCGGPLWRKPWEAEKARKKGWKLYCSTTCRDVARRGTKGQRRVARVTHTCVGCGGTYERLPSDKPQKFCSVACANKAKPGRPPLRYKKLISREGYVSIYVPPAERMTGQEKMARQAEHRVVMARSLGRPLEPYETVHHINGDKGDNRLENLQLRIGSHGAGVSLRCRCCGSSDIETVELE